MWITVSTMSILSFLFNQIYTHFMTRVRESPSTDSSKIDLNAAAMYPPCLAI